MVVHDLAQGARGHVRCQLGDGVDLRLHGRGRVGWGAVDVCLAVGEDGDADTGEGRGGFHFRHGGHVDKVHGGGVLDGLVGAGGVEFAGVGRAVPRKLALTRPWNWVRAGDCVIPSECVAIDSPHGDAESSRPKQVMVGKAVDQLSKDVSYSVTLYCNGLVLEDWRGMRAARWQAQPRLRCMRSIAYLILASSGPQRPPLALSLQVRKTAGGI